MRACPHCGGVISAWPPDMEWLREIPWEDLLDRDSALIHQECGADVLIPLWGRFTGISFYVSERFLFEAKRRYIRKFHDPGSDLFNTKALAAKLRVSERFVQEALATTERGDDRQGTLLPD